MKEGLKEKRRQKLTREWNRYALLDVYWAAYVLVMLCVYFAVSKLFPYGYHLKKVILAVMLFGYPLFLMGRIIFKILKK
jgi:hypothetical protein